MNRLKFDKVVMVSTWCTRHCDKSLLKEITLRIILYHVWSAVVISGYRYCSILSKYMYICILNKQNNFYFTFPFFSLFSNVQSDSFRGVGSQIPILRYPDFWKCAQVIPVPSVGQLHYTVNSQIFACLLFSWPAKIKGHEKQNLIEITVIQSSKR
jgi:hypothetical protein